MASVERTWSFVLFSGQVLAGAASEAGIRLSADLAPPRVLMLRLEGDRFLVEPLVEGVRLRGKALEGAQVLEDGDLIEGPGLRYFFRSAATPGQLNE